MDRKKTIALFLVIATLLIGGAAVYIGLKLGEQPTVVPDDSKAVVADTYYGIRFQSNLNFDKSSSYYLEYDTSRRTVCMVINTTPKEFLGSKHWCDTNEWIGSGCNCPNNTASCDPFHIMADGSLNQQGYYSPSNSYCTCQGKSGFNGSCSDLRNNSSLECSVNVFNGKTYPQKICLDRNINNKSETYCGQQQIDYGASIDEGGIYLSGYMGNVPECQDTTTTPTISILNCGDYGCLAYGADSDAACGWPGSGYECKDGNVDPNDPTKVGQCAIPSCPEGYIANGPCECIPSTTTTTPSNTNTITPSPPTRTPTNTGTPIITLTGTVLPPTALVSDEVDLIIMGMFFIILGAYLYKSGLYVSIGNLYWNNGGKNINNKAKGSIDSFKETIMFIIKLPITTIYLVYFAISKTINSFINIVSSNEEKKSNFEDKVINNEKNKEDN